MLVLASIFSQFDVFLHDPSYTLEIKQALTIKPKDMLIRVAPRQRKGSATRVPRPVPPAAKPTQGAASASTDGQVREDGHPLLVLYGSNTGTSQAFAQRIASDAYQHGKPFSTMTVPFDY